MATMTPSPGIATGRYVWGETPGGHQLGDHLVHEPDELPHKVDRDADGGRHHDARDEVVAQASH